LNNFMFWSLATAGADAVCLRTDGMGCCLQDQDDEQRDKLPPLHFDHLVGADEDGRGMDTRQATAGRVPQ
jgi:hypothetical protein